MSGFSFGISGASIAGSSLPQLQRNQQQKQRRSGSSGSARSSSSRGGHTGTTNSSNSATRKFRANATKAPKPRKVTQRASGARRGDPDAPISMERATVWSPEVEEAYRIQGSGWRNIREYRKAHGDPLRWENGFVKMTVHPKTGYFMYWSKERACAASFLAKVKIYKYASQPAALQHNQESGGGGGGDGGSGGQAGGVQLPL